MPVPPNPAKGGRRRIAQRGCNRIASNINNLIFPCSSTVVRQLAEASCYYVNMYWVYALYNKKHNKIYIGQTVDLEKSLRNHNNKQDDTHVYTRQFDGVWVLMHKEIYKTRQDALIREKQLKSYRGREFVKKLIHSPVAQR